MGMGNGNYTKANLSPLKEKKPLTFMRDVGESVITGRFRIFGSQQHYSSPTRRGEEKFLLGRSSKSGSFQICCSILILTQELGLLAIIL